MVDRVIVYDSAIPQTTDILQTNKMGMIGQSFLARAILGSNVEVNGLVCLPTSPASLQVTVSPGSIYELDEVDATAYGDLGVDANTVVKQAINYATQTLTITPPGTTGFSQVFLVQVALNDVDAGSQVLSYFNAANPLAPFSGPFNSGQSQFTTRTCKCAVALKAGVAATTGTQTTPAADVGYTGLYAITVANGATTVTSDNIVTLTSAPFFPTLPSVPAAVQDCTWIYAVDSSTGGAPFQTNATTGTASAVLHFASVPSWVTAGMTVFDLTTPTAITGSQTVLSTTSTSVTMSANANATVGSGDSIAFSFNTIIATISPVPAALVPGMSVRVKLSSTNTAVTTFNLNGLGAVAVHRATGAGLAPGDIAANMVVDLCYDGSAWQVANFEGFAGGTVSTSTVSIPYATDTGTVNAIVASFTPAITSLSAGTTVEVKAANTNSGATTIAVNALSAVNIVDRAGNALLQGALNAGEVVLMIYDGTQFQVVNNTVPQIFAATTFYVNNSTGSNSNNGLSSGTAWATIAHAITALSTYNLNGNTVTLQLATTGINYVMPTSFSAPSAGALIIQGDTGNQANVTITNANAGVGVANIGGGNVTLQYLTIYITSTVTGVFVESGLIISINYCTFTSTGPTNQPLIECGGGALVIPGPGNIYGASADAIWWVSGAVLAMNGNASTANSPTWSAAAVVCEFGGTVSLVNGSWTWSGSGALGPRYAASLNGVIYVQGRGANYFPGSSPGTTTYGGIYL